MQHHFLKIFFTIVTFLTLSTVLQADELSEIKQMMKQNIGEVTTLIQDKSVAKEARDREIETIISPLFDFGLMGRLSLGKQTWKKISKEERKAFSELFKKRVRQSYMSKLDLYTDEVVVIDDPIKVKNRIHLPTHLMRKNEKRDVLYKFYKSKKSGWMIYDVDILGVSIIQTYRTQFSGILKKESFATLLEKLKSNENS